MPFSTGGSSSPNTKVSRATSKNLKTSLVAIEELKDTVSNWQPPTVEASIDYNKLYAFMSTANAEVVAAIHDLNVNPIISVEAPEVEVHPTPVHVEPPDLRALYVLVAVNSILALITMLASMGVF